VPELRGSFVAKEEVEVEFVTVAQVGEIPDGEARGYEVGGVPVAVCNCNGRFLAVSDICTHAHALLHEGSLDRVRCTIECALHGAEYDLRTGEVLTPPATEPVTTLAVRVDGDEIKVALPPEE
jgi:3-phenylpropionate/trans-cinnamate dioxygenase ferredoxin subunit